MPDWKRLIEAKISLAKRGAKPSQSSGNLRVPAGQTEVKNFPILDLGIVPELDTSNWKLRVYGLVEHELNLDWEDFQKLPQVSNTSDFHCVTRWSQLDMEWIGVSAQDLLMLAVPLESAKFVTLHGFDGYTTNIALEALLDDDVILAHSVLGKPLTREHGGPVRMVIPKRYAWKGFSMKLG